MPIPCYFFGGLIERAGGVFVPVPSWDPEAIERAVTPQLARSRPDEPEQPGRLPAVASRDRRAPRARLPPRPDGDHRRGVRALHPRGRARERLGRAERDPDPQPRQEPRDARLADRLRRGRAAGDRRLPARARVGRDPRRPRRPAGRDRCARRPAGLAGRGGGGLSPGPRRRPRGDRRAPDPERCRSRPRRRSSGSSSAGSRRTTSSPRASRSSTALPSARPVTRDFRSEALPSTVADGYRIGVDIGGTFTDVVLLGADGTLRTKKVLSTPDDYARGVVQGILELLRGDRGGARERHQGRPRDDRRLERGARREGLELLPADDGRLPRRARAAAAADPGDVRAPVREAAAARPAPAALRDPRADRPARRGVDRAGRAGGAGGGGAGARRRRRRGRDQLPARVREPGPRAPRRRRSSGRSSATTSTSRAPPTSSPRSASTSARARRS